MPHDARKSAAPTDARRSLRDRQAPGASPATETYRYDRLYRLQGAFSPTSALETYGYNRTGDRISKNGSALATGLYTYAAGTHRLTGTGNQLRTNDANGNMLTSTVGGSSYAFIYDARNRLAQVKSNGATAATYQNNALGQRLVKVTPAGTERYIYDEAGHLLAEYGLTNRDYIWAGDLPVAVIDNTISGSVTTSTVNYITADQLDTPRAVSNAAGATIWSWAYQTNAFGEKAPAATGTYVLNLRFSGQYFDAETGTSYNYFRNYEPATGRYVQSDPMGLMGGMSTFGYVKNNPLSYSDSFGLWPGPPPMGPFSPEGPGRIPEAGDIPGNIPGGPWTPAGQGQRSGTFFGPKQPTGPRAQCQYVPSASNGGPPGSPPPGYWKTKAPGQEGWNRYDINGNPKTPDEIHPAPGRPIPEPVEPSEPVGPVEGPFEPFEFPIEIPFI